LDCGSHLPLYVDEQRKSSANVESLPVWKPMHTQPLRNRKVTNLIQDLTLQAGQTPLSSAEDKV
jgi:hypothetical protein